ncbi:MAG: flagellar hook-length control protein FliK, partial [Lachnospiraceae bacterium]|nr:flagellar hook-length control protein FliK [Lachnospiraceae bacterium]
EFFLKMNDSIVSDLIVNEDLNMQLQDFMSEVSEELQVLDTLTVDADVMLSEETVKSVIEQVMPNKDADIITNQSVSEVTQESVHDEPEVIITNETTQTNTDTEQSTDNADSQPEKQEQEVVSKQTTKQEVETNVTEHATTKQNTFENPILQAIQNAVNTVETVVNAEQPVQQVDIVRQVVEQVRVNMNQQATSLELQLYPEHLGRIQINVVSKDGVLTASIVAETEAAKQAIEGGLLNLKEAMQQQDLKVEAIEVMVSTMGFEKGEEQQQSFDEKGSSNPRRKIDLSELGEAIPVEDEVEIEKMKATGSSVSYRA